MSIIDRLNKIADKAAKNAVNKLYYRMTQQTNAAQPTLGQVTNILSPGTSLSLLMADGSIQTATLINGVSVGIGSYVVVSNGFAWGVDGTNGTAAASTGNGDNSSGNTTQ